MKSLHCCAPTQTPAGSSPLLLLRQPRINRDIFISDIGSIKQAGRARPLLATSPGLDRGSLWGRTIQINTSRNLLPVLSPLTPAGGVAGNKMCGHLLEIFMVNNGVGRLQMQDWLCICCFVKYFSFQCSKSSYYCQCTKYTVFCTLCSTAPCCWERLIFRMRHGICVAAQCETTL